MPLSVLLAVLFGALLHAAWNVLVKRQPDKLLATAGIYLGSGLIAALCLPWLPLPAPAAWPYLGASTVAEVSYGVLLARAYRAGDLSHAYPLMRGAPPLIVALGGYVLARESLSAWACAGIALVSGGILSLIVNHAGSTTASANAVGTTPHAPARAGSAGLPAPSATPPQAPGAVTRLALTNALVIACYTLMDGLGVRASGQPLSYILWLFLLTSLAWLFWSVLFAPPPRRAALLRDLPRGIAGGAFSLGSYGIALWAMTRAPIAAVAAVRETSIVFGVLLGRWVLKERITPARAVAALMVTLGVYLIRGSRS